MSRYPTPNTNQANQDEKPGPNKESHLKVVIIDPVGPLRNLIASEAKKTWNSVETLVFEHHLEAKIDQLQPGLVFIHILPSRLEILDLVKNYRSFLGKQCPTFVAYGEASDPTFISHVYRCGFDHYTVKPFSVKDAMRAANNLLTKQTLQKAA